MNRTKLQVGGIYLFCRETAWHSSDRDIPLSTIAAVKVLDLRRWVPLETAVREHVLESGRSATLGADRPDGTRRGIPGSKHIAGVRVDPDTDRELGPVCLWPTAGLRAEWSEGYPVYRQGQDLYEQRTRDRGAFERRMAAARDTLNEMYPGRNVHGYMPSQGTIVVTLSTVELLIKAARR